MSDPSTNPVHPRRLYLAVDCGGSKAAAAISVSSSVPGQPPKFLSRGFGGAANYTDVGLDKFLVSVQQAVEAALDQARIEWRHLLDPDAASSLPSTPDASPSPSELAASAAPSTAPSEPFAFPPLFHAAWLGIAGVDSPLNIAVLSPHLSKLLSIPYPSPRLIVANDTSLLAAPVMERDDQDDGGVREGVVCIAGTGSIVMSFRSRQQQQQQHHPSYDGAAAAAAASGGAGLLEAVGRVGGFGWLLGDEAGGYMVGKKAVRAVLDQADRERLGFDDHRRSRRRHEDSSSSEESGPQSPSKHLLRDRILSHWNLDSTDDLLDTVYSNDVLITNPSGITTQATQPPRSIAETLANGHHASSIASPSRLANNADPSQNLLPPGARPGSGEGPDRTTSTSPIPSIPSYPSSPLAKSPLLPLTPAESASPSTPLDETQGPQLDGADAAFKDIAARLAPSVAVDPPTSSPAPPATADAAAASVGVRKLRLASLAPLVFHLAFTHGDEMSLDILRGEIRSIVSQIELLLQRKQPAHRAFRPDPFDYDPRGLHGGKGKEMMMLSPSRRRMDFDSALDPHNRRHGRLSDDDDDADVSSSADSTLMSLVVRESSKVKEKAGKLRSSHATSSANGMGRMGSSPGDWEAQLDPRRVLPSRSTLCLGGSLLGVEGYRELLVEELRAKGWEFKRVVYVEDAARRGCEALARGWETPK